MTSKPTNFRPFFAGGLVALLASAWPATAQVSDYVAGIYRQPGQGHRSVYTVDVTTLPPTFHGPFFTSTFDVGFRLVMLRDAAVGIVGSGAQLHRIDFSDPEAPSIVATVTLPFTIRDMTRLADARDELVAMGNGGELAVVDPNTLGTLDSFTLPSARSRVRLSRDGRLLLTVADTPKGIFLATFDSLLGPGAEVPIQQNIEGNFEHAVFSLDSRTLVLAENWCHAFTEGSPICETYFYAYDISSPAQPHLQEKFTGALDAITGAVSDRSGQRLIFHHQGNNDFVTGHKLQPFTIAGPGDLTAAPVVELTDRGDFEGSGMVRTAGAKRLLVFSSATVISNPPVVRLHDLDPVSGAGTTYAIPVPLMPRGVFHTGADIFADGFESGGTATWSAAF